MTTELPFATTEMLDVAGQPESALDMGCGSGRLTVELARRGAAVTGIDTNDAQLAAARSRAKQAAVDVEWMRADFNVPLPFSDGRFDAVVSRLSLMVARDPVATLREAARVLRPGGVVVTAVWAAIEQNPWFGEPRSAIADALGADRARFAAAFGTLGDLDELEQIHRAADLGEVRGQLVSDERTAADAAEHLGRAGGQHRTLQATRRDAHGRAVRPPDGAAGGAAGVLPRRGRAAHAAADSARQRPPASLGRGRRRDRKARRRQHPAVAA